MKIKFFMKIFVFIIFYSLVFGAEKEPLWVKNPSEGLFVGISKVMDSEQEARIDAVKDAKRQIIATLGGLVETEFVDRLIEEGESSAGSFTDSKVKIVAKNILSVKTKDLYIKSFEQKSGFMKKKIVYQAFAAIPFSKSKHENFMNELVSETEQIFRNRFENIIVKAEFGQIVFALNELRKIPNEYKDLMNITGLTPTQLGILKKLDQDIKSYSSEIKNNIHIVSKKQKYLTKMNKGIDDPLEIFVYWNKDGNKIPVQGIDVKFENVSGKVEFNATEKTNNQGFSECKVSEICSHNKIVLRATVEFPEDFEIDPLIYNFYLLPDNKISIKIIEKNQDELVEDSYLENLLMQRFTEMNFQVVDIEFLQTINSKKIDMVNASVITNNIDDTNTDFLIFGRIIIDRTVKYTEGIHFAWAKASVKIYDVEKSEIIESIIHEEKGAGNSDKAAGVKAIKKASEVITKRIVEKINNK